mmetsp:Transcript_105245/g.280185  ORF Transcript_105245/g.280185 Transcript_105245/m.280185 type:complete len:281 (-) Transcript_105245:32-874(-)
MVAVAHAPWVRCGPRIRVFAEAGSCGVPRTSAACSIGRSRRRGGLRIAWLLLASAVPARGAYFYVVEGSERCFQEDLVEHQVLRMSYTMHAEKEISTHHEPRPDPECIIALKDPRGKAVKEHAVVNGSLIGALAHAAQEAGPHQVCLSCEPQEWFNRRKLPWSISFDVLGGTGIHGAMDPSKMSSLASLNAFKGTQAGIDLLMERVSAISSENEYERTFEARFMKASEAVNMDVATFKVLEVILVTVVTAYQIHHLAKFLQRSHLDSCGGCLPMCMRPVT